MKSAVLIVALVFWSGAATAQRNDIVTSPHGGKLQEVAGVEVELLVGSQNVTLCVYSDSNTLLDAGKYQATVTIVSGANRERIALQPRVRGGCTARAEYHSVPIRRWRSTSPRRPA